MAKFVSLDRLSEFKDKIVALLNSKVNKAGDTMTGALKIDRSNSELTLDDVSAGRDYSAIYTTNGRSILMQGGNGGHVKIGGTTLDETVTFAVEGSTKFSEKPKVGSVNVALETDIPASPTVITGTLSAGSTSLTLSNSAIATSSVIDVYTDVYGVNPTAISVSAGSIALTFDAQSSAVNIRIEVK